MSDFIHISTGSPADPSPFSSASEGVPADYYDHGRAKRFSTESVILDSIRTNYPHHHLTVTPLASQLLAFGDASNDATYSPHGNPADLMAWRLYTAPARRLGGEGHGTYSQVVQFGCFDFAFKDQQFLVYIVEGAVSAFNNSTFAYILFDSPDASTKAVAQQKTDELIAAATKYSQELHSEVLVFDQGYWLKNRELWENIQEAEWEDVILEKQRKKDIINDVAGFFDASKKYKEFGVPWKRGLIFWGPAGNGKTITTKALMHDILKRKNPTVGCLYVKTFKTYAGAEAGIRQIFLRARQVAPCILIFEDIDSLVSDSVRSYFLNEVDGLESNHGILMIGSTNHLERLDPGIAKRPSRFDRKYLFDVPNREERIQYCEYWRNKLRDNKKIDFPEEISPRVAQITANFSFAYLKEAFVAALLVIVRSDDDTETLNHGDDPLEGNQLFQEIKRQVENLRKDMDDESDEVVRF